MIQTTFFDAVWNDSDGHRVIFTKQGGNRFFLTNTEALNYALQKASEHKDVYFGAHLFGSNDSREAINAIECRALYLDVDAGENKPHRSSEKARAAIDKFVTDTGLPKPTLICSGNGIHAYFLLKQAVAETAWLDAARKLKALCKHYGLQADACVTANSAQILRIPGTVNYKESNNPKPCDLLTDVWTHEFEAVKRAMDAAIGNAPNFAGSVSVNDSFLGGIEKDFADDPQKAQEIARLCLPHLSREKCDDYAGWLNVGIALHNIFADDDEGLQLWDGWSKQGGEYNAGVCADKWQGFGERNDGEKLGVGSLVFWAKEDSAEFCEVWEKRLAEKRREKLAARAHGIQLTDYGNAQRLVALHGADLRYDYARKLWFVWNGKFWKENAEAAALQFAKATVKEMYSEASQVQDDARRQALAKHAHKSEAANRIKAMIDLARSEPEMQCDISDFDAQPHLLNVANGVIDLRTGRLLPHARETMLSHYVPIEFNPSVTSALFEATLERLFKGNRNLIEYMFRAFGYSITGETREQCFFFCYGSGANGKSTLLETVLFVLGDLGGTVRTEALMKQGGNSSHSEDVAILRGKRFVTAAETESGQQLAESHIKQITGGDTLTVSRKYGYSFSLKPQFKLWIAANHKPQVSGTDEGIWRRFRFIPFEVQIPKNERDLQLKEKLQAEAQGILTLLVRGAVAWYAGGLGKAPEIENATLAYRNEQDSVASFIAECCETGDGFSVRPAALLENYKTFCSENGYHALNAREFPSRLMQLGYSKNDSRLWNGIRVKLPFDISKSLAFTADLSANGLSLAP